MLGTLDDDRVSVSLVEAVVDANGERVMSLINEAAARGIEWEALLVEMPGLLHRTAWCNFRLPRVRQRYGGLSSNGCANFCPDGASRRSSALLSDVVDWSQRIAPAPGPADGR